MSSIATYILMNLQVKAYYVVLCKYIKFLDSFLKLNFFKKKKQMKRNSIAE